MGDITYSPHASVKEISETPAKSPYLGLPNSPKDRPHQESSNKIKAVSVASITVNEEKVPDQKPTAALQSTFTIPTRMKSTTPPKVIKMDPPSADLMGALTTLEPGQPLSATAIQLILGTFEPPTCRVLDPLFLNTNKGAGSLPNLKGLEPQVERLIVPLHHEKTQHWTLAYIDIAGHKIRHFDSLPLKGSNRVKRIVEIFASSLDDRKSEPWTTTLEEFCKQGNAYDCGIYVCIAAIFLMAQQPPPTDLNDCSHWRLIFRAMFSPDGAATPLCLDHEVDITRTIAPLLSNLSTPTLSLPQLSDHATTLTHTLTTLSPTLRAAKSHTTHLTAATNVQTCCLTDIEASIALSFTRLSNLSPDLTSYTSICSEYKLLHSERKKLQPKLDAERRVIEIEVRKVRMGVEMLKKKQGTLERAIKRMKEVKEGVRMKGEEVERTRGGIREVVRAKREEVRRVEEVLKGLEGRLDGMNVEL